MTQQITIRLTPENADKLRRLETLLNLSSTAVLNYVTAKTLPDMLHYFEHTGENVRESFREVLNDDLTRTVSTTPRARKRIKKRQKVS